jgi:hypothetical protein
MTSQPHRLGTDSMSDASHDLAREAGSAVVKVIPPIAIWSITLNDWLAFVSILYVLVQFAYLIWKWQRHSRRRGFR